MEIEKGNIMVDGVDVRKVELKTLRERITTIPQDPALFQGTLRYNIDPLNKVSDERINDLLERSGLNDLVKVKDGEKTSEFMVEAGGDNLSAGQKQLVCICRAAVRKAKVVIFDEATANVDVLTEHRLMELVKTEFADATVLTIAHRLNTIINSDMILVMGAGKMKEYDSPENLLKNPESDFAKLIKEL